MSLSLTIERGSLVSPGALSAIHEVCFEKGWSRETFQDFLDQPIIDLWGAYDRGKLIGFLLLQHVETQAEILTFAVAPAFQNQGVGGKILEKALNDLKSRGMHSIFLEVGEKNNAALKLYTSFGFKKTGIRKGYYARKRTENEDAYGMELNFIDLV